jgi:predicted transposase YdaD
MRKNVTKGLEKIQSSSPQARMRWAIGLTTLITILVLFVWIKSIDDVINISSSNPLLIVETSERKEKGLIEKLRIRTAQTIVYFQRKFSEKNEISIEL